MKYIVVEEFRDLRDAGRHYKVGDFYPYTGEPDAKRVQQLMQETDMRGALIAEYTGDEQKQKRKKNQ